MGRNQTPARHDGGCDGWRGALRVAVDVGVRAAGARRLRAVLVNAAILTFALAAFAVAQNADDNGKAHSAVSRNPGDPIELGRRNPGSGGVAAETAIVANRGNDALALRLTNNAPGGRANSSTCTNDATDPTAGCHVYVNKGKGIVASFRSAGSGVPPFAVRNTNDGMVTSLNSQFVNNNQVACPDGTQLVGGFCFETALRQNGQQVQYEPAFNECLNAGRRLPTNGESALIGKTLNNDPSQYGTGNWADDTGISSTGVQTGSIVLPSGFHVQIARTDAVQFRCVTSPISPKPPTPQG
jgi:hypothetical protein